ncbi:type II toxin-antitoxin system ParD family antitoxin [Shinella curvata]|uniref:Type II toxin-antitoxin system ParD family antitoxin n=1 Tax=Shinella curvata TaxID=1817964 RepID=A0ABT8XGH2_9HYPH|nr:type II toxin-antitoxin system ParD family antitoxin [Shinella curvata]MCJ8053207.1 type II toxin-antitoxin system ParD family antitoxin [Shinella curvata]MDO6122538.1 type II toxin-antitoxin system ParD family antitoxin [Shinella curvata]
MKLSIAKELENYIADEVESGRFADASAVVNDALRLHESYLASVREDVGKGLDDLANGRFRSITAEEFLTKARAGAV